MKYLLAAFYIALIGFVTGAALVFGEWVSSYVKSTGVFIGLTITTAGFWVLAVSFAVKKLMDLTEDDWL